MKTIIVKTQKELDELPSGFDEYTRVEIRSSERIIVRHAYDNSSVEARGDSSVDAWGNSSVVAYDNSLVRARGNSSVEARGNSSVKARNNSSVVAWDNSSVVAWDNSSVIAWDSSSVELFLFAYAVILWPSVKVKRVLDHSTVVFKGIPANVSEQSETAHVREVPGKCDISFEEWLRRGYVVADGIYKKLKSQKTLGEVQVFECEDFPKKKTSYVVRRGDLFSHGETVEKAIEDLRFKIGDRDTSEFESWREDLDQEVSFEDAIAAYRTVTGACEFGVKEFVKSIQVPEKLTPNVILKLTEGHYGSREFREFLIEQAKKQVKKR